jgi:hypothetical protein
MAGDTRGGVAVGCHVPSVTLGPALTPTGDKGGDDMAVMLMITFDGGTEE